MSIEENKAIVGRWFAEFWGPDYNPAVIDELAAPEIRFEYSLHAPCRGRDRVREFATNFRAAFPDLAFGATAELIAEGDYVVGQWRGGGTHTGDAFDDMPIGSLAASTGKTISGKRLGKSLADVAKADNCIAHMFSFCVATPCGLRISNGVTGRA
jgi:hypothetical protein